jgi:hypothetical protein
VDPRERLKALRAAAVQRVDTAAVLLASTPRS